MHGTFIVLEGPDGSGTTRHSAMLTESLRARGMTVITTAEPTDSAIGKEIRTILSSETMPSPDAVQLLFCADRANHVSTVIEPALRSGAVVVCDRYALSTIVYGAVMGLSKEWLKNVNDAFPKPDLTIIALPPFDVCMERIQKRGHIDVFETENLQRRVYEEYRMVEDPSTVFVDTSGTTEDVADFILRQVLHFFDQGKKTSVQA
ncbi:dTMP kinase [Candidatus Peregrinibacteria bacterium]|nr:dTMP kinase [Candidatus Peregrinibacteria bacterium]